VATVEFDPWLADRRLEAGKVAWKTDAQQPGHAELQASDGVLVELAGASLQGGSMQVRFDQPAPAQRQQLVRLDLHPRADDVVQLDTRSVRAAALPLRGVWQGKQLTLGRESAVEEYSYRGRLLDLAPWQAVWQGAELEPIHLQGDSGALTWVVEGQARTGAWQEPRLRSFAISGAPTELGMRFDDMRWRLIGAQVEVKPVAHTSSSGGTPPHALGQAGTVRVDQGNMTWRASATAEPISVTVAGWVEFPLMDGLTQATGLVHARGPWWQAAAGGWQGSVAWSAAAGQPKQPRLQGLTLLGEETQQVVVQLNTPVQEPRVASAPTNVSSTASGSGWLQADQVTLTQESDVVWQVVATGNVQLSADLVDRGSEVPVRGVAQRLEVTLRWDQRQSDQDAPSTAPVIERMELIGPATDPAQWYARQEGRWFRATSQRVLVTQAAEDANNVARMSVQMGVDGRLRTVAATMIPTWSAPALPTVSGLAD
jgi:hypothetical protein